MKHPATRELYGYWNSLRGARTAPDRCDIEPTAIRAILADTFMLDVAGDFPVRLAGTRVGALLEAVEPGGSFLDAWRAQERHNLAAALDAVADGAHPVVVGATGAPAGQPASFFELLFLPLRHFGRTHSRILGLITPARTPGWLGFSPLGPLAISSLRVVESGETGGGVSFRSAGAMATVGHRDDGGVSGLAPSDWPMSRRGTGRPAPGRPILRLIEGGLAG